jgi:L-amino acid N-acyltransferase YncA
VRLAARLADCDATHLEAIRAIFNTEIATSTALWEENPRSEETLRVWWDTKVKAGFPVIGAFDGETLVGFATYGQFRPQSGYSLSVEHSIYLVATHRGRGIGRQLLEAIVKRARSGGMHAIIGVIDAANSASRRLHESAGFEMVGKLPEVGRKFDRWLDACFYQKTLS